MFLDILTKVRSYFSHPVWLCYSVLPSPELIEGFETDKFVPSIISVQENISKKNTSIRKDFLAFDLPKEAFIKEVLQIGLQRDFQKYSVRISDLFFLTFLHFLKFLSNFVKYYSFISHFLKSPRFEICMKVRWKRLL